MLHALKKTALVVGLLLWSAAGPADASVVYTVSGSADLEFDEDNAVGPDVRTFSFVLTQPTFIGANILSATLDSCSISGVGFTCTGANFLIFPPTLAPPTTGSDLIELQFTTPTGSASGTLAFEPGAFASIGLYLDLPLVTIYRDGGVVAAGSFGPATLAVTSDASPVPGPIVGAGLPGLVLAFSGFLAWRRRSLRMEAAHPNVSYRASNDFGARQLC